MVIRMVRYVALDIETTGFNTRTARIVEIHLAEVSWPSLEVESEWGTLLNPGLAIPAKAIARHGITDDQVEGAPTFASVATRVQRYLAGAILIAFCGRRHDVPIINAELRRVGLPGLSASVPVLDPYEQFVKDSPRSLSAAVEYYLGRTFVGAHRAANDVHAMLEVCRSQLDREHALTGSAWAATRSPTWD